MQSIIIHKRDIPFYMVIGGIFILLKLLFIQLSTDDLRYFLLPLDGMLNMAINSDSVYLPARGYYHHELNILIDKSCSGFNFILLCFMMLSSLAVQYSQSAIKKLSAIVVCLCLSCGLALFVNTARILTSVMLQQYGESSWYKHTELTHQVEGVFIYLFFLIVIYAGFRILLTKKADTYA